jgi:hypothetical protein
MLHSTAARLWSQQQEQAVAACRNAVQIVGSHCQWEEVAICTFKLSCRHPVGVCIQHANWNTALCICYCVVLTCSCVAITRCVSLLRAATGAAAQVALGGQRATELQGADYPPLASAYASSVQHRDCRKACEHKRPRMPALCIHQGRVLWWVLQHNGRRACHGAAYAAAENVVWSSLSARLLSATDCWSRAMRISSARITHPTHVYRWSTQSVTGAEWNCQSTSRLCCTERGTICWCAQCQPIM